MAGALGGGEDDDVHARVPGRARALAHVRGSRVPTTFVLPTPFNTSNQAILTEAALGTG